MSTSGARVGAPRAPFESLFALENYGKLREAEENPSGSVPRFFKIALRSQRTAWGSLGQSGVGEKMKLVSVVWDYQEYGRHGDRSVDGINLATPGRSPPSLPLRPSPNFNVTTVRWLQTCYRTTLHFNIEIEEGRGGGRTRTH